MSAPIVVFFNNKGGVGKTTIVYNLAWMFAELGVRVLMADLDPQANLTVLSLGEERAQEIWAGEGRRPTIYGSVESLLEGAPDIDPPHVVALGDDLGLIPGDLALWNLEDELNRQWSACAEGDSRALQVTTAFGNALRDAADRVGARLVLVDTAPTFGAINRAVLSVADDVVIPVSLDPLLPHNLKFLGDALGRWRQAWKHCLAQSQQAGEGALPGDAMAILGYVVTRSSVVQGRMVRTDASWMSQLPALFHEAVLGADGNACPTIDDDPYFLGLVRNYHTLMGSAHEAHKPVFLLRPADGAMGAHQAAVTTAWENFRNIAGIIAHRMGLEPQEQATGRPPG